MRLVTLLGAFVIVSGCLDTSKLDEPSGATTDRDAGGAADASEGGSVVDASATDASVVDGAVELDAGVDAMGGHKLYVNGDLSSPNVWSVVPLGVAWTGANAPPSTGIMAVVQLTDFDRLLVWANDGKFYVRDTAGWRTPQLTATVFPQLAGKDFRGAYHQPSNPGTAPASRVEEIILVDNPSAFIFHYLPNDGVTYQQTVTMTDEGGTFGAPKASKKARWVMRSWRPAQFGTAAYLAEYSGYDGDPNVYFFDATPAPTNKWAFADAPLFKDKTNVPPQADIMAAWRDDKLQANYLVVR